VRQAERGFAESNQTAGSALSRVCVLCREMQAPADMSAGALSL
jgi:hypothetical protein